MSQTTLFGRAPEPTEEWDEIIRKDRAVRDAQASLKKQFHAELDDGVVCPTCNPFAKRYRRKFTSSMARALIWLSRQHGRLGMMDGIAGEHSWIDVPKRAPRWLVQTNQLPTVRWWGMIERRPTTDDGKKHSGLWRVTPQGVRFVMALGTVPSTVVTYNGEPVGFEGDEITIREALGTKFDYAELMGHH